MGVDLAVLGNHQIEFASKTYFGLGNQIKAVLDKADFPNQSFVLELLPNLDPPGNREKTEWDLFEEEEDFQLKPDTLLEFTGPFGLELSFHKNKIIIWSSTFRYYAWFNPALKSLKNSWRKYFKAVVNLFGGDRVIYLRDHELYEFDDFRENLSFSGLEKRIQDARGESREIELSTDAFAIYNYCIDRFEDINSA